MCFAPLHTLSAWQPAGWQEESNKFTTFLPATPQHIGAQGLDPHQPETYQPSLRCWSSPGWRCWRWRRCPRLGRDILIWRWVYPCRCGSRALTYAPSSRPVTRAGAHRVESRVETIAVDPSRGSCHFFPFASSHHFFITQDQLGDPSSGPGGLTGSLTIPVMLACRALSPRHFPRQRGIK